MSDTIGWFATALFASSYFAKSRRHLLVLQIAAAFAWIAYGMLLGALPVIVANSVVATAATFTVLRARRADSGQTHERFVKAGP